MSIKNKNPLFVVTNSGKDVEQAESMVDALIKRLGLDSVMQFLEVMMQSLIEAVGGMVALDLIASLVDDLVDLLEQVLKVIDPVLAFSVIKR